MSTPVLENPEDVKPFDRKARSWVAPSLRCGELGWDDPVIKSGRWRMFYYGLREHDPFYYDPTITDSMLGPGGAEHGRTPEMGGRELPGKTSYKEWCDRRYFLDPNIKAIYENYPIAKQHPGLGFRMNGLDWRLDEKDNMPHLFPGLGLIRQWPGILPGNWKFFGAPFGEECHVKTAVCAKYGLIWGTTYFMTRAPIYSIGRGWRYLLKEWAHYNSYAVSAGAAWAAASCIACSIRGKDDSINMFFGGAALGSMIGIRKGFFHGWRASIVASIVGLIWYYGIAFEQGLVSKASQGMQHGNVFIFGSWDPYNTKWANFEGKSFDKQPWNF